MTCATKYDESLRNLAELLVRSASAASYEDAFERAEEALFWYANGLRAWMINDPDVSCDDFHEVLEIDPRTIFDMVRDEYRARKVADEEARARRAADGTGGV